MKTIIRDASFEDVEFVAWTVLMAIDIEPTPKNIRRAVSVCSQDGTLYSWRNARICEVDGKVAGCLVSYGGNDYRTMRKKTFDLILDSFGLDLNQNPDETIPGEFYLDSMAFLPEFRGNGLGKKMLIDGIEKGKLKGYAKTTLLVDEIKPNLMHYYESIGFKPNGKVHTYGEDFTKMAAMD